MEDASLDDFLDAGEGDSDDDVPPDDAPSDEDRTDEVGESEVGESEANQVRDAEDGEGSDPGDSDVEGVDDETEGQQADEDGVEIGSGEQPGVSATYRYDPSGVPCPACGETVPSRWHDGERLVCAACKSW